MGIRERRLMLILLLKRFFGRNGRLIRGLLRRGRRRRLLGLFMMSLLRQERLSSMGRVVRRWIEIVYVFVFN